MQCNYIENLTVAVVPRATDDCLQERPIGSTSWATVSAQAGSASRATDQQSDVSTSRRIAVRAVQLDSVLVGNSHGGVELLSGCCGHGMP